MHVLLLVVLGGLGGALVLRDEGVPVADAMGREEPLSLSVAEGGGGAGGEVLVELQPRAQRAALGDHVHAQLHHLVLVGHCLLCVEGIMP